LLGIMMAAMVLIPRVIAAQNSNSPQSPLPVNLQARFRAGVQALKSDRLTDAQHIFEEVIRAGGETTAVHTNLGIVFQMQHEHTKAIAEFRRAIRLDPDDESPYVLMGASLLSLGQISDAIRQLNKATLIAPNEPLARLELGKAYLDADQPLKAVEQFQILRRISPDAAEYAYELGIAYLKLAEWCTRNIQRIDPRSVRLLQVMAEGYRAQGQLDRAKTLLESAVREDPKLPGLHLEIAEIALQQGNTQVALAEVRKELALVPQSAAALALESRLKQEAR